MSANSEMKIETVHFPYMSTQPTLTERNFPRILKEDNYYESSLGTDIY